MATANATEGLRGPGFIKRASGWYIAIGVVFIVLGIVSIAEPGLAGLAVALLVGWLLIFAGGAHLLGTFSGGGVARVVLQLILGVIYVVGGIYFLTHPLLGLGTLTLLLAGIILAEAVLEFLAYFRTRNEGGSGWRLANGLISLILGGLIWFHWPSSSVWAIGTLVGVNLMMRGISRLMLGAAVRRLARRAAAETS